MSSGSRPRTPLVPLLVKLTHASAPFLSTFLLIHLSAPILANVGGSNLSSNVMLLGREHYQTSFGEKYLLLTPFVIHVTSGIVRRIFAPPSQQPRKPASLLSLAAYSSLVFLPIHVFTHRFAPTNPSPPILAVGPAELDYEFVKTGLSRFPWCSWAIYAGLVTGVLLHAVEGMNVLCTAWLGVPPFSPRTRKLVTGMAVLPVILGMWSISKEPLLAFSSTIERYSACFSSSWVYRV